jgi:predicted nuclease with RNAse H fold
LSRRFIGDENADSAPARDARASWRCPTDDLFAWIERERNVTVNRSQRGIVCDKPTLKQRWRMPRSVHKTNLHIDRTGSQQSASLSRHTKGLPSARCLSRERSLQSGVPVCVFASDARQPKDLMPVINTRRSGSFWNSRLAAIRSHRYAGATAAVVAVLAASAAVNYRLAKKAERDNPPTGKLLDINGVRLHYVERGAGDALVLLHGNGSMIEDFASSGLIDLAAKSYRVITFDRPGFGHSERPRGTVWTPEAQAELIYKALERLVRSQYKNLKMPVDIIAGQGDRIIDIDEQSGRLHREVPHSKFYRVPGAGHMVHQTAPDAVMVAINDLGGNVEARLER